MVKFDLDFALEFVGSKKWLEILPLSLLMVLAGGYVVLLFLPSDFWMSIKDYSAQHGPVGAGLRTVVSSTAICFFVCGIIIPIIKLFKDRESSGR